MPRALPTASREDICRRHLEGAAAAVIAASCRLNVRTVRRLLRRFRRAGRATPPDYDPCGRPRPKANLPLRDQALALRRLHPGWGAGRILAELSKSCRA